MRQFRILLSLFCFVGLLQPLVAQDQALCRQVVDQVIATADEQCLGLGRDKVCYGNADINIEPQNRDSSIVFNTPGDQMLITEVASMQLSALDAVKQLWGIALFRLQAINLENTSPGQLVTLITFGGTRIEPRALTEDSIVGDPDISDQQVLGALQGFYLQTGIGTAQCLDIPTDGVLIQSQQGQGTVYFQMNGVDVELNSTIFVQSLPAVALKLFGSLGLCVVNKSSSYIKGELS